MRAGCQNGCLDLGSLRFAWVLVALLAAACHDREVEPADTALHRDLHPAPRWHYELRPAADLSVLEARVCFAGRVPARLDAQSRLARTALLRARRSHGNTLVPMAADADGLDLGGLVPGECVHYDVDLRALAAVSDARLGPRRHGQDLLLSPDDWLWRPVAPTLDDVLITASFALPAGIQVAVPWPQLAPESTTTTTTTTATAGAGLYRIPPTAFAWPTHAALGRFALHSVAVGHGRLRVAVLDPGQGQGWRASPRELDDWLARAASTVAALYGSVPAPETLILIAPAPGERVVHGHTAQGGGPSVVLFVGTGATAASLRQDSVAVHELLHLGMPVLDDESAWLGEGVATYYEAVLAARAGWIPARTAWERLHQGFRQGALRPGEQDLAEDSRTMRDTGQHWRVYWAGAALALIADVALRSRAIPGLTLDAYLQAMRACCLAAPRTWSARELLARAAAHAGLPDLGALLAPYLARRGFPALASTYRALGLVVDEHGQLAADPVPDAAPDAQAGLRHAIMAGTAEPAIPLTRGDR